MQKRYQTKNARWHKIMGFMGQIEPNMGQNIGFMGFMDFMDWVDTLVWPKAYFCVQGWWWGVIAISHVHFWKEIIGKCWQSSLLFKNHLKKIIKTWKPFDKGYENTLIATLFKVAGAIRCKL